MGTSDRFHHFLLLVPFYRLVLEYSRDVLTLYDRHYPETLERIIVINGMCELVSFMYERYAQMRFSQHHPDASHHCSARDVTSIER